MDFKIAREMVATIRAEKSRLNRLNGEDGESVYDQREFSDEPFINDMCLMVLVGLHHQLEGQLIFIAACANTGAMIDRKTYQENIVKRRKQWTDQNGRKKLQGRLNLESFPQWSSMEALRLLANSVKHDPWQQPDKKLLAHLKLPPKPEGDLIVGYDSLSESDAFRKGLAGWLNLPQDADYCTIADTFINAADQFLRNVRRSTKLARITGGLPLTEFVA